jgi:hypothetical protein
LIDAEDRTLPSATRDRARAFLRGTDGLKFWCEIGGLRVQAVSILADRTLSR